MVKAVLCNSIESRKDRSMTQFNTKLVSSYSAYEWEQGPSRTTRGERERNTEREYIKDIWLLLTIQEIAFGGWERKGRVFDLSIMIYLYTAFLQRGKIKEVKKAIVYTLWP